MGSEKWEKTPAKPTYITIVCDNIDVLTANKLQHAVADLHIDHGLECVATVAEGLPVAVPASGMLNRCALVLERVTEDTYRFVGLRAESSVTFTEE